MKTEAYKFTSTDAENYEHYLGPLLFEPYAKITGSHIESIPALNVLELAAGSGRVTRHIRRALSKDAQLLATDISADMIAIAKHNLDDTAIQYKTEDIQNLSFPDNTFDLVVCQFGMMFLPDKQKGFSEIHRVLKPGGRFLCFTWDSTLNNALLNLLIDQLMLPYFAGEDTTRLFVPFSLHDPARLRGWINEAGFHSVGIETIATHSGPVPVEHVVEGLFLKHPLGKAMAEKGEEATLNVETEFRLKLKSLSNEGIVSLGMSALLTSGFK